MSRPSVTLPEQYMKKKEVIQSELRAMGVDPKRAIDGFRQYLVAGLGAMATQTDSIPGNLCWKRSEEECVPAAK